MNAMCERMKRLTDEGLYDLSAAIDGELERRRDRRFARGSRRSTYMSDMVRGNRMAKRDDDGRAYRLAA